jgi:hypothetical protein
MSAALDSPWRRLRFTGLSDLLRGRVDGSLDWRRLVETSGLPAELTSIVSQLVRRARLWPNERVAVATEFVSHFREGLEAGQTPAELASSFGDVAAAAKLIRRAKKRGRPLWWHAWRWCFWGVAAIVASYAFLWVRMWWGRPEVRVDYFAEVNRRAAAVDPNTAAWPVYVETIEQIGLSNFRVRPLKQRRNELDPRTAVLATQYQEVIARLREASSRPGLGAPIVKDGEELSNNLLFERIVLRALDTFRMLSSLLESDAQVAAWRGDFKLAVADVIAMVNLGNQLQEQSFLTSGYVSSKIYGLAYAAIEDLVRERGRDLTDDQLRDLAHALAGVQLDWAWWIEGERMANRDLLQRLFTDDGNGDGHITVEGLELVHGALEPMVQGWEMTQGTSPQNMPWWRRLGESFDAKILAAPVTMASRREMTETMEEFFDRAEASFARPYWTLTPSDFDEREISSESWKQKYYPLTLMLPAVSAVRQAVETQLGVRDGLMVGIALELYRREAGEWPKSLEALTPRFLPQAPVDRLTGKPLGYRLVDGAPVVYSVGADLDDDGGRASGEAENFGAPNYLPNTSFSDAEHDGDWVLWGGETAEDDARD